MKPSYFLPASSVCTSTSISCVSFVCGIHGKLCNVLFAQSDGCKKFTSYCWLVVIRITLGETH